MTEPDSPSSSASSAKPIRVLVVDDSPTARDLLVHLLNSDPGFRVVGVAVDGESAIAAAQLHKPDVITMDIHMPKLDGYTATRRIMEVCPTRIVMVTASSRADEVAATFAALEAGALTVIPRPLGPGSEGHEASVANLLQTIRLMSEVKVVRRWPKRAGTSHSVSPPVVIAPDEVRLVAIGASTGGPPVLQTILSQLPPTFPVPIAIVQHIAEGFTAGFAEWLGNASGFHVSVARDGEVMQPGHAYLAPDGHHMAVAMGGVVVLSVGAPDNGLRPSVAHLFRSVVSIYGRRAVGVLLTGMGKDGAQQLREMRDTGAVTLAQDRATSVVNGMPGEAVRLDGASYVLSPDDIALTLRRLVDGMPPGEDARPPGSIH